MKHVKDTKLFMKNIQKPLCFMLYFINNNSLVFVSYMFLDLGYHLSNAFCILGKNSALTCNSLFGLPKINTAPISSEFRKIKHINFPGSVKGNLTFLIEIVRKRIFYSYIIKKKKKNLYHLFIVPMLKFNVKYLKITTLQHLYF